MDTDSCQKLCRVKLRGKPGNCLEENFEAATIIKLPALCKQEEEKIYTSKSLIIAVVVVIIIREDPSSDLG
jgi:hypothetical protein